jgi:hypothetical protein
MENYSEIKCETCEYLLNGICTNVKGIHGRGWRPGETDRDRGCWSISLAHFTEIVSQLPDYEQKLIRNHESISVEDLLHRVDLGFWSAKVLKKTKEQHLGLETLPPEAVEYLL